jgi:hypothetical protein
MNRSTEWIDVRAKPWEEEPVPGWFRYKLNPETTDRRFFRPDLDAYWTTKEGAPGWLLKRRTKSQWGTHTGAPEAQVGRTKSI